MLRILLASLALKATLDHPPAITDNCNPARVHFTGHINADSPGLVKYTWVRSERTSSATFTLTFTKAGSLPVSYDWLLKGPADGWVVLQVISPEVADSGKVRFQVKCGR